jgi:DNA polymerase-2
VFDFKSLYPSVIRTFNIDPLSYVAHPGASDALLATEGGAHFRRASAILPGILDQLFPQREAAQRAHNEVAAHAIKILMNSFYGVLGTPACRFYNPALANAITGQGRHLLQWSQRWFESRGFKVLYGDTDSLFIHSGINAAEPGCERGAQLAQDLNRELAAYTETRWRVASRFELKFEKLYLQLFLPRIRHGTSGARKRYAGLLHSSQPDAIEFVGMEVVRSDWTELAKRVQRELYLRLFRQQAVDHYLAEVVAQVRRGELDDALVYRKNLRKEAESYTATTPPHVAAARKSNQSPGSMVSYVITSAGPEPTDNVQHPLDREHYVTKQIRPVAEPVLGALGLDFERVIGDNRQLDLIG